MVHTAFHQQTLRIIRNSRRHGSAGRRKTIGFNTQNGPSDAGWFGDHFFGESSVRHHQLLAFIDISSAFFGPPKMRELPARIWGYPWDTPKRVYRQNCNEDRKTTLIDSPLEMGVPHSGTMTKRKWPRYINIWAWDRDWVHNKYEKMTDWERDCPTKNDAMSTSD